jgi:hypothetical protein
MTSARHTIGLLLLSASCASHIPYAQRVANAPGVFIKERPVQDLKQARHHIQNKVNFIKFTFEQSRDPYYGTPKWSDGCLKANKIGAIKETSKSIQVRSTLYLNESGEVGHCPENEKASEYLVSYYYCEGSGKVVEASVPLKLDEKVGGDLCDD